MIAINSKIKARLANGLKYFQPILNSAKLRDINESDTVVIVTDILSTIFGYDKYSDVTSEHSIKGTFCDIAVLDKDKFLFLVEVKASGTDLKENHIKQAVDYATNKGVDWVVLTNGYLWRIFKVIFSKPISQELVAEINLLDLNTKNQNHLELLYLLSKEGFLRSTLSEYHIQLQATNKFLLGNLVLSENILEALKRNLKLVYPNIKVDTEEIKESLIQNVIKRDILEGSEANEIKKKINRLLKKPKPVMSKSPKN